MNVLNEMPASPKKILVALSGGVDSSVAALRLLKAGHHVEGITCRMFDAETIGCTNGKSECAKPDDQARAVEDASNVAAQLGIQHHVVDMQEPFGRSVIDSFCQSYLTGKTPNPCIECNKHIKFGKLDEIRAQMNFDFLATGHYVRRVLTESKHLSLQAAEDESKDQSYFLACLSQEQLAHALFPLGDLSKDQVREMAAQAGLETAHRPESQDICFVSDGNYMHMVERYCKHNNLRPETIEPGDILNEQGSVLGKHSGIARYTIGQRKGIGIAAPEPLYVLQKNAVENTLTVGPSSALLTRNIIGENVNFMDLDPKAISNANEPVRVFVKTHYRMKPQSGLATFNTTPSGTHVHVQLDEPFRRPAAGQVLVFYTDAPHVVLASATIADPAATNAA